MNKQIEVVFNILPLLSTIEEGLIHIRTQLAELRYEEAYSLLEDAVAGIDSIDNALKALGLEFKELQAQDMEKTKEELNKYLVQVVNFYEDKNQEELEKIMELVVEVFLVWKEKIESIVRAKIAS